MTHCYYVFLELKRVYNTVINRPFEEILILPVVRIHPLINQISWNMSLAVVWRQNRHRRCASPPLTDLTLTTSRSSKLGPLFVVLPSRRLLFASVSLFLVATSSRVFVIDRLAYTHERHFHAIKELDGRQDID